MRQLKYVLAALGLFVVAIVLLGAVGVALGGVEVALLVVICAGVTMAFYRTRSHRRLV